MLSGVVRLDVSTTLILPLEVKRDQPRLMVMNYNELVDSMTVDVTSWDEEALVRAGEAGVLAQEALEAGDTRPDLAVLVAEGRAAVAELFQRLQGLVIALARARNYRREYELDELIAQGNLGLLRAIYGFDASRGSSLASYAHKWIYSSQSRAAPIAPDRDYVSARRRMAIRWDAAHGVEDLDDSGQVLLVRDGYQVDNLTDDSATRSLANVEARHDLAYLLTSLNPTQRRLIEMRFGLTGEDALSRKQTAERLGMTISTVRRCELKALATMRDQTEVSEMAA